MTIPSRNDQLYHDQVRQGLGVDLPEEECELHRVALEVIASKGIPSHLTPYGSVRSIAAFALDRRDDPFYRDGERLLIREHGGESEALKATHPDRGGDERDFLDVQAAREASR